ncbi:SMODS-associated NUDIX domain-containing protein, partial [Streptomyces sp. NPDC004976]
MSNCSQFSLGLTAASERSDILGLGAWGRHHSIERGIDHSAAQGQARAIAFEATKSTCRGDGRGGFDRHSGGSVIEKIVVGAAVALLGWIGRTLVHNRRHLSLLRLLLIPRRSIRVSVAVLLRVQDEDHYVLFSSPTRPGSFGPPGGVVKYHDSERHGVEKMRFDPEARTHPVMKHDLRGFLPAAMVPGFARWLHRGTGREPSTDCLRRELAEELGEIGHPELTHLSQAVGFSPVRKVIDGPWNVPGEQYRQIRFLEVYDLLRDRPEADELRTGLLTLSRDPGDSQVIGATRQEILRGRSGPHQV